MQKSKHSKKPSIAHDVAARGKPILITGGSGFVGANLAHRLLRAGRSVILYDNLSRAGVETNARWLASEHGDRVQLVVGDVRDEALVRELVAGAGAVFHFAAQVAVTTSLLDPMHDFEVNVRGTLNVLEALRRLKSPPPMLYTSTNKVYGALPDVALVAQRDRYEPEDAALCDGGIDESRLLDFHSPYGCSKGAADQYVIDYARSFGLPAAVFRMSCIYGPRQFGTEDQGWVAHFLIRAAAGQPITIYGDGKQVRDLLFVGDLVDAMLIAERDMHRLKGNAYNLGGGPRNVVSLIELVRHIGELLGEAPRLSYEGWRTGDQRYYVSNTAKFQHATGWYPKVSVVEGLAALSTWLTQHRISESRTGGHAGEVAQAGAAS